MALKVGFVGWGVVWDLGGLILGSGRLDLGLGVGCMGCEFWVWGGGQLGFAGWCIGFLGWFGCFRA